MAVEQDGIDITLPAAADLSSYQHRLLLVDDNGRGTIALGSGTIGIGILQNKPAAQGRGAAVRIAGVSKYIGGAGHNERDLISSNTEGMGVATTTAGAAVWGQAIVGTSSSLDVGQMLMQFMRY